MKTNYYLFTLILSVFSFTTFAQEGTVRGTLIDADTQEPLIGGIITIDGTSLGSITDIDGSYSIQVPAGTYSIKHTYIGYQDKTVSDVEVIAGEVNALGEVSLGTGGEGSELEEVVVTAYIQKNTEEGLLNFQRESTKIVDAVSAQSIAKTGDSDVAAVVKRVPGVTIESGKYVYVRGLGDRYSKSILNGMEIPGLDPDKNSVQMDIFPSNIISNIVVYKTFSPDLPGDFTGGMVDVTTKDFPSEKTMKISTSFGYNTEATFSDNYINNGGATISDRFGFGKMDRELPFDKTFEANRASDQVLFQHTDALNKDIDPEPLDNFLNQKLSFSYGNQYDLSDTYKFGLNAAINYNNNYNVRPNVIRDDFVIVQTGSSYALSANNEREGVEGYNESLLNGLLGFAVKNAQNKYSLKLLHTRTGENSSTKRSNDDNFNNQYVQETTLDYFERSISNAILEAEHYFKNQSLLDWKISGTYSTVDNPERTSSVMEYDPNSNDLLFTSGATSLNKQWRELLEYNVNGKIDYELPINTAAKGSMIKFGVGSNYKEREFETYTVAIDKSTGFDASLTRIVNGDLNQILRTENIVTPSSNGYEIASVQIEADNAYNSDMMVMSGYGMTDYRFTDRLKFIGGLRVENAVMNYQGQIRNANGQPTQFDDESLNSTQLLPSANFVFEPIDYMNIRASYNRTLARPSFKEKSGAIIYDAINSQRYYGNIDLVETTVNNFDLRWEYFFAESELVSISPFYKAFADPIELTFVTGDEVKPFNKEDADVYGFETEIRKNLGFLGVGVWENMSLNSNFTFVKSSIPLTDNEKIKYDRNGVAVPKDRDMLGQAPYSINASINYGGRDKDWEANLGYNVKGKTLAIVGIADIPDIYEDPFHNLDLKVSKKFGANNRQKISLTAQNLMNDNVEYNFEFSDVEAPFRTYDIGQSFSLGYSIDLQ